MTDPTPSPSPASPAGWYAALGPWWRALKAAVVFTFVCWHLFYLLWRNPMDLWEEEVRGWAVEQPWWDGDKGPAKEAKNLSTFDKIDRATIRYGALLDVGQGWAMFSPPMWRYAPFLAAAIDLDDGSEVLLLSPNEFESGWYFRAGGWRQRKLESELVSANPVNVGLKADFPVWQAYARWSARRWREQNSDDPRTVVKVRLLRRDVTFPKPNEDVREFRDPARWTVETRLIGTFAPDGELFEE